MIFDVGIVKMPFMMCGGFPASKRPAVESLAVSLLTKFPFALLAGKLCLTLAFSSGAPRLRWVHCGSLLHFCIHRLGAEGSQASEPWGEEDLLTLQHV